MPSDGLRWGEGLQVRDFRFRCDSPKAEGNDKTQIPCGDDNQKGNGNGVGAGSALSNPAIATARRMGARI